MKLRQSFLFSFVILLISLPCFAQNKQLTIDDIFDPQKRISFGGSAVSPRWLKDGVHYTAVSKDRNAFPRLLKVNAGTGKSEPFYNAAKMEAAFAALAGMKDAARRLANQTFYQMNAAETGVLINHANDLFYYDFGSDRALRVTHSPEEKSVKASAPTASSSVLFAAEISTSRTSLHNANGR